MVTLRQKRCFPLNGVPNRFDAVALPLSALFQPNLSMHDQLISHPPLSSSSPANIRDPSNTQLMRQLKSFYGAHVKQLKPEIITSFVWALGKHIADSCRCPYGITLPQQPRTRLWMSYTSSALSDAFAEKNSEKRHAKWRSSY